MVDFTSFNRGLEQLNLSLDTFKESNSTISSSGKAIFKGIPGNPAPVPTSITCPSPLNPFRNSSRYFCFINLYGADETKKRIVINNFYMIC